MKKRTDKRNDGVPVIKKNANDRYDRWYKTAKYCELFLKCIAAFVLGVLFSKILKLL